MESGCNPIDVKIKIPIAIFVKSINELQDILNLKIDWLSERVIL